MVLSTLRVFTYLLLKRNNFLAGHHIIIAAVVHLLLLSRLVEDSKTCRSCLSERMGSCT